LRTTVIEHFKSATEILGGEKYVTSLIIVRVFKNLLTSLKIEDNDSRLMKNLKTTIYDDLKKRIDQMGSTVFKAAALNSRYRALKFLTAKEKDNAWKE
jgi:hypothetical protein